MTWVFDVDGTIIDSMTGASLRPGAGAILERLTTAGARVILWSAGGDDYARLRAEQVGVAEWCAEFYAKALRDESRRYRTDEFLGSHDGVVFVDDSPVDLPIGADIVAVRPYLAPNLHDRGLDALARRIADQY